MSPKNDQDGISLFSTEHSYGLQVIVCSLPRTGTTSIKLALEQLGYPNVYHMSTFVEHTEDSKLWGYAIEAKASGYDVPRQVWDSLLRDYQVVVDAPGCYFAAELAKAYPNAKVVILNRDPEKWYTSFAETVQKLIKRRESLEFLEKILRPCLPAQASAVIRIGNLFSKSGIGLGSYGKEESLEFFHRYYADCRASIAAERCIDFKVQDGWSPLCEHLGAPVPRQQTVNGWIQAPFPQANDTESFHSWVTQIQSSMLLRTGRNMMLYGLVLIGIIVLLTQATWFARPSLYAYCS
ncbi:P-loop containing nucleoside triphosphate hydrolase protein [Xylaria telfairii]|nr:P-loop containing nucleoside triphosphate hydrolase protein [Xylaria telfairii]